MTKEQEALENFLKEYLFLCEKLHTNQQEKMLLDENSPYNILKKAFEKSPEPFQTGIDLGVIKPKKYLTWEDLEFKDFRHYYFKVKSGDSVYEAFTYFDRGFNKNTVVIETDTPLIITDDSKQLFNDLHFEKVGE